MKSIEQLGNSLEGLTDDLTSKEFALSILRALRLDRLVNEDYLKRFYLKNKNAFDKIGSLPASAYEIRRVLLGSQVLEDLNELEHDAFAILDGFKTSSNDDFIYSAAAKLVCRYIESQLSDMGLRAKTS